MEWDVQLPELFIRVGQVAITFGLAELSFRWIESPIRHYGFRASLHSLQTTFRRWSVPRKFGVGAGLVVVAIHLGSNRPFEDSAFDEVMKRLLAYQVERVIFINVHRPIGWEYYINRKFAEDVARWPQAELIDWDAIAHSEQGWFIEDQTHLSYFGSKAYVAAIKEKLDGSK